MSGFSWRECEENEFVIKSSPNIARVKSLIETAEGRIALIKKTDEQNCNYVFEDYYSSLLEFLQALVIKNGYKVLNHLCLGFYLKDVLKREDLFRLFDDLRYKRNSLLYYGKRMDFEICKESIEKCIKLIKEIRDLLNHS